MEVTADNQQILTDMVSRRSCVIYEGKEMEQIFILEDFPVLMCSTEKPKETDQFMKRKS